MHNPSPGAAEANGNTPQAIQGIRLGKNSLATVQDLEIALDAAVHINRHLNRELEGLSEQLRRSEADKHAWEAQARRLAKQLAKYKLSGRCAVRLWGRQPCWCCACAVLTTCSYTTTTTTTKVCCSMVN